MNNGELLRTALEAGAHAIAINKRLDCSLFRDNNNEIPFSKAEIVLRLLSANIHDDVIDIKGFNDDLVNIDNLVISRGGN